MIYMFSNKSSKRIETYVIVFPNFISFKLLDLSNGEYWQVNLMRRNKKGKQSLSCRRAVCASASNKTNISNE